MSYILEALRRAEREREQGQGVTVTGAAGEPVAPPSRRGPLMTAIVALLAINALVVGVFLLRDKPAPTPAPLQLNVSTTAPAPVTSPALLSKEGLDAYDEPVVEQGVASMDDLGAAGELDEPAAAPQTVVEGPAPAPRGRVTFAKKPLTPVVKPVPSTDPENDVADTTDDAPAEVASTQAVAPAPALNAAAAKSGIKPLSDMSAAYQATFPQWVMEVHVYDAQPQRRFAMIGGQRYHEGDALPQGARLVGIVPEGLVVDFRNETVLYPIGRH